MERLVDSALSADDVPPKPGEGEKVTKRKAAPVADDLGDFADLRNMAAAVRELQDEMSEFKKLFGEDERWKVFEAAKVLTEYLESQLDPSEFEEEKRAHLERLAVLLKQGRK